MEIKSTCQCGWSVIHLQKNYHLCLFCLKNDHLIVIEDREEMEVGECTKRFIVAHPNLSQSPIPSTQHKPFAKGTFTHLARSHRTQEKGWGKANEPPPENPEWRFYTND